MPLLTKNDLRGSFTPYIIQVRETEGARWVTYQGVWPDRSLAYSDEEVDEFAVDQGNAIMEYVTKATPDFWELYTGIRVVKILAYADNEGN